MRIQGPSTPIVHPLAAGDASLISQIVASIDRKPSSSQLDLTRLLSQLSREPGLPTVLRRLQRLYLLSRPEELAQELASVLRLTSRLDAAGAETISSSTEGDHIRSSTGGVTWSGRALARQLEEAARSESFAELEERRRTEQSSISTSEIAEEDPPDSRVSNQPPEGVFDHFA